MSKEKPEELVTEFLNIITFLKKEQNLTHEQLAEIAGVHRTTIGLLERHERVPTIQLANQLALALGYPLSELIAKAESKLFPTARQSTLKRRGVDRKLIRNEDKLYEITGLDGTTIVEAIEKCYFTLDIIDSQLFASGSPVIGELVELANLSSVVGNLLGSGIAEASSGLYKRNRPHSYPDLIPQRESGVDLELKMSLETNKPKGHLPKPGVYITFRYVLGDQEGNYSRGKDNRGNTVWLWEVKVGKISEQDFGVSNTAGDSGKTAVIKTDVFNQMPLIFFSEKFLPYKKSIKTIYPGYN